MNARAAIKLGLDMGELVSLGYLEDLTDAELMKRPTPGCNHIKWQVGHLVASEHNLVGGCCPGQMPALPAGFESRYTNETANSDNPADFHSKDELLAAYRAQRAATLATLNRLQDSDLDQPSPESMQSYAPTVGAVFSLQGSHWLMHAGQWAVIRRQLGRKPLY